MITLDRAPAFDLMQDAYMGNHMGQAHLGHLLLAASATASCTNFSLHMLIWKTLAQEHKGANPLARPDVGSIPTGD